jgi:SAM-dependent methyltransferase
VESYSFSKRYSEVFDLLYESKPYEQEAKLVLEGMNATSKQKSLRVLDVACGTGKHLVHFARQGHTTFGNDLSEGMVQEAKERFAKQGLHGQFVAGPAQNLLDSSFGKQTFDLVGAFFTALGYMVTDEDQNKYLNSLSKLTDANGYVYADCWHGPKMSKEFSPYRKREFRNDALHVVRESFVTHHPKMSALEVKFSFDVKDLRESKSENFSETHLVRYHNPDALASELSRRGFEIVKLEPFFDDSKNLSECWNFYILARKKG